MYNDIRLEKGLYNLSGKSFTAALEALDPTSAYIGTELEGLDAYERQLKRFDIKVGGSGCDRVEKFFSSTETAVLFPEFVVRSIRKGFDETVLGAVTAVKTISESGQYLGCVLSDTAEYDPVAQTVTLPAASITEGTDAITLEKFGRLINASYEAVRRQRLDSFSIMLRSIGIKLAAAVVGKAFTVLKTGTSTIPTTSLTYADLADLYGSFDCFNMTTLIASPAVAAKIAAMEEMKEANSTAEGRLILPFGAEMVKTSAADDNTIIGIDKEFALEFITSTDLVLETDKLIDRQLDQITVSVVCGFRKLTPEAVKGISITSA